MDFWTIDSLSSIRSISIVIAWAWWNSNTKWILKNLLTQISGRNTPDSTSDSLITDYCWRTLPSISESFSSSTGTITITFWTGRVIVVSVIRPGFLCWISIFRTKPSRRLASARTTLPIFHAVDLIPALTQYRQPSRFDVMCATFALMMENNSLSTFSRMKIFFSAQNDIVLKALNL